jgi:Protein of unknown function (DUF1549)/Protein of unknown function (DUF1553)/Planctomycete cytochrome C
LRILIPWLLLLWYVPQQSAAQSAPGKIDFERDVQPVLASRCQTCHSQEKRSGGLSLASYEDVMNGGRSGSPIKPGKNAQSLIIQRITGEMEPRMPFGGAPLPAAQIAAIRSWIDEGARPNPAAAPAKAKWEASLALTAPAVPASTPWPAWSAPIDRFTANYLVKNGVTQPKSVSDSQFARRAYLDIWGLLPPPGKLRDFVADKSPDKRSKLVQQLLADDTKYAENWISFWNDLLRNDEGVNYYSETASRKSISKWLLTSLESNLPYNQFAGKLINPSGQLDPDGFLIGVNWRGTVSASQTPALQAAQNTAQIFLGINLKCNSCHDSFISKWKLKDAYALASYFSEEEQLQLYRCDVAQHKTVGAAFLYPELNRSLPSNSVADRRATAAAIFTDPRDGRLPRTLVNRFWERLLGHGIIENVDDMDAEPWSAELLDWLASDFVSHGYDMKRLLATIISSQTYQLQAVEQNSEQRPKQYVFRGPEVRRLTAEQFSDAIASITGDWHVAKPSELDRPAATGNHTTKIAADAPANQSFFAPRLLPVAFSAKTPDANPSFNDAFAGSYSREWRIAASSLTRALGRPIRDQVFSTRDNQPTTIQAVELVNGETLTHWLARGSRRMLGELPAEPASLYAAQVNESRDKAGVAPAVDLDISKSNKLYLIVQDALSTAPDKAAPLWVGLELEGPHGSVPLSSLKPREVSGMRDATGPIKLLGADGVESKSATRVKLSSVLEYDIVGKGYRRLRGTPGFEPMQFGVGESVQAQFFIFDKTPSLDRLIPPHPGTPLPSGPVLKTKAQVENWVFEYALDRLPSGDERQIADAALENQAKPGTPSPDGLADLLWAVVMKPEFQLIY